MENFFEKLVAENVSLQVRDEKASLDKISHYDLMHSLTGDKKYLEQKEEYIKQHENKKS